MYSQNGRELAVPLRFPFNIFPSTMSNVSAIHYSKQCTFVVEVEARDPVEDAIERILASPEFSQGIASDTRDLSQTAKYIREGFRMVASALITFDSEQYRDRDGEVLQLRPQWLVYQADADTSGRSEAFDEILEKSHCNALAASSMIRQYTQTILTDVDPSELEDLRDELQGFLKKLDEKAPTARRTQGDLQKLADDVRSFKAVIDETLAKAEGKCVSDIDGAKDHLQKLHKKLESINDDKATLGVLAVGGLLAGGTCAIAAMFLLAPSASESIMAMIKEAGAFGLAYCGIEGWNLHKQGSQCVIEMKDSQVDVVQKTDRHCELLGHQAALSQTKQKITALAERVDTIISIWRVLKCDMQQLQEQLTLVVDPDMKVTKRFVKKLSRPREVYNRLADLLELPLFIVAVFLVSFCEIPKVGGFESDA
ncbi:hypothetical protein DICSQDRAFT_128919 [Dichomitus squalens LYAD-421 SS1]|uniref:Uncharacterized protein n=1 Tax=Dichomitus squalens (strain LYAD-421) TaxID=732165 RepID=R7STP0_DICSQ|nr:uncharacterized protein DICSQDRAFT_128919 [Dichomitus squalens LYAD-421 SS1]EJF58342.1 hypothetical protein DICSQDRAFT_128919 [Dichomitus squalens LYAD-421 SS1]